MFDDLVDVCECELHKNFCKLVSFFTVTLLQDLHDMVLKYFDIAQDEVFDIYVFVFS